MTPWAAFPSIDFYQYIENVRVIWRPAISNSCKRFCLRKSLHSTKNKRQLSTDVIIPAVKACCPHESVLSNFICSSPPGPKALYKKGNPVACGSAVHSKFMNDVCNCGIFCIHSGKGETEKPICFYSCIDTQLFFQLERFPTEINSSSPIASIVVIAPNPQKVDGKVKFVIKGISFPLRIISGIALSSSESGRLSSALYVERLSITRLATSASQSAFLWKSCITAYGISQWWSNRQHPISTFDAAVIL